MAHHKARRFFPRALPVILGIAVALAVAAGLLWTPRAPKLSTDFYAHLGQVEGVYLVNPYLDEAAQAMENLQRLSPQESALFLSFVEQLDLAERRRGPSVMLSGTSLPVCQYYLAFPDDSGVFLAVQGDGGSQDRLTAHYVEGTAEKNVEDFFLDQLPNAATIPIQRKLALMNMRILTAKCCARYWAFSEENLPWEMWSYYIPYLEMPLEGLDQ